MPRKTSTKGLKKKAWSVFSEYIRKRGADENGYTYCCSCGQRSHWRNLQAGHYYHGHSKQSFFDEINVHGQCVKCNHYLSGNLIEYTRFMQDKYTKEQLENLRLRSKQILKLGRADLEAIIKKYGSNHE